jgi:hypothetical protein
MAAWKGWMEKHHGAVITSGGQLGKTKKVAPHGIEDRSHLRRLKEYAGKDPEGASGELGPAFAPWIAALVAPWPPAT